MTAAPASPGAAPASPTAVWIDRSDRRAPVATIRGPIDLHSSPQIRAALEGLIAEGARDILMDMAGAVSLDSAGLAVLVDAYQWTREMGGVVYLVEVPPAIQRSLDKIQLSRLFRHSDSIQEARASLAGSAAVPAAQAR